MNGQDQDNSRPKKGMTKPQNPGFRKAGYIATIIVMFIMIYVLRHLREWGLTFLTEDFERCLFYIELSIYVTIGANILFILTSALAFFIKKVRSYFKLTPFWGLIASTIWACSVVQTLLDHGDNPRFLVPLQSMAVLWSLWILFQLVSHYRLMQKSKVKSIDRVKV